MGSFSERKGIERDKSDERDQPLGVGAVEKKGEERERRYKEEEDREVGGVSPFKGTGVSGPQGPGPGVRVC